MSKCVKPSPSTPKAPKQKGPIKTPATRYAVTAGRLTNFARRDNINPAKSAIDKLNKISIKTLSFIF